MEERLSKEMKWFVGVIIFLIALVYFFGGILPPFLAAFIIAYLGSPVVSFFEKVNMPRTLAAALVFIMFIFLIVLAFVLIIPILERQLLLFYDKVPDILVWLQEKMLPWINQHFGLTERLPIDYVKEAINSNL